MSSMYWYWPERTKQASEPAAASSALAGAFCSAQLMSPNGSDIRRTQCGFGFEGWRLGGAAFCRGACESEILPRWFWKLRRWQLMHRDRSPFCWHLKRDWTVSQKGRGEGCCNESGWIFARLAERSRYASGLRNWPSLRHWRAGRGFVRGASQSLVS